ncbi:Rid family hydrolase [Rhodoferax ferrireducens]|uniref:chorismate transformation enzyme, FkbO/Hyg5 family n=1 Tax=Rhodoferax ferrireducens TaxID=192843 RepID=UPI0018E58F38|nr:Rid family hydrolase [Rhodoferax ferrireducens]
MSMPLESLNNCRLSFSEFSQLGPEAESHVLGAIGYFAAPLNRAAETPIDAPFLRVSMPALAGMPIAPADAVCDVWLSASALTQGQCGDVCYRHDGNTLFGVIELAETDAGPDATSTPLQFATERAYRQIFGVLETLGYPFLFRLWNYMADINGHSHGQERYRQFNLGRQDAFLACRRDVVGNVPAACALGSASGPLTIAFMAGRQAPLALENPRQISAYNYPENYGPRSPTFSRASLVRLGSDEVLLISGTASIVGHDTLHAGDVQAQTHETLTNLEAIIQVANLQAKQPLYSLGHLFFRVYVRHSVDVAAIQDVMDQRIGASFNAVFLQADVCRQDLLMEIEASASRPV